MTSQRQDLVLFSDQSVIPRINDGTHKLFLISATGEVASQWLINALLETKAKGVPHSLNGGASTIKSHHTMTPSSTSPSTSTIISFVHDKEHYTNNLNKLQLTPNQCHIIDCVTDFVLRHIPKYQGNKIKLLQSIIDQINDHPQMIVLDQPELLLSLVSGLTSDELWTHFIIPLWRKTPLLIININNNMDIIQEGSDYVNKDLIEFQRFITSCHYHASVILNLRPLSTGHAKDITGTLRITRGGVDWNDNNDNENIHVIENEYLYLTEKDSTRLFYG